ncbi:putative coil containing protein [Vibrio phage 237E40-1]|nr:putative coil containing protein [Vibrio phage 237E40-1]
MLQIAISKLEQHKEFTIVFIGGKNDGTQRVVSRIPPFVNMPEQYKRLDLYAEEPDTSLTSNTTAVIYAHHALTDAEVLNIILTRYVQGTSSENK